MYFTIKLQPRFESKIPIQINIGSELQTEDRLSFQKEKLNFPGPRLTKRGHATGEKWTKVRLFTNKK